MLKHPSSEEYKEFTLVRRSTIALLRGLPEAAWSRTAIANNSVVSARALAYIISGHELHHVKLIKEKYLV